MKASDIREILEPFATTKIHNPNKSNKAHTTRVMSVKALAISRLKGLYDRLLLNELFEVDDSPAEEAVRNIMTARDEAERKAWDSLSRYKFEMFGYWASAWVKYNQLMPKQYKLGNPFGSAVKLARQHLQSD